MKTLLISAAAIALAVPAFANDGLEGRDPGQVYPVTITTQLAAGDNVSGMTATSVIAMRAAEDDDDAMSIYALRTAPEVVSTQNGAAPVDSQISRALGVSTNGMSLSAVTAAYLDEVADD
ncbi:MAG: hypothetical protein AAGF88_00615 [Pseudomonadota bacterium]